jgi:hypothetical protein
VSPEFAFSAQDFTRVRGLIAAYAGISLHERKQNMVYNRLSRRLRATGLSSFRDYLDWVEAPQSEERERFVNALTTNLTSLFREPHHFDMLVALAKDPTRRKAARLEQRLLDRRRALVGGDCAARGGPRRRHPRDRYRHRRARNRAPRRLPAAGTAGRRHRSPGAAFPEGHGRECRAGAGAARAARHGALRIPQPARRGVAGG